MHMLFPFFKNIYRKSLVIGAICTFQNIHKPFTRLRRRQVIRILGHEFAFDIKNQGFFIIFD